MASKDPVCGMAVKPATAKHRSEHAGHTCGLAPGRRIADRRFSEMPSSVPVHLFLQRIYK